MSRLAPIVLFESEVVIWGKPIQHHPPAAQTDQARLLNVATAWRSATCEGRPRLASLRVRNLPASLEGVLSGLTRLPPGRCRR